MKRGFMMPRPSLRLALVLGLVVGALATVAAVAVAGDKPADLTFTPKKATDFTNIDVARAWAKNYYGAPGAAAGPNGNWDAPLNQSSNYAAEASEVARKGED